MRIKMHKIKVEGLGVWYLKKRASAACSRQKLTCVLPFTAPEKAAVRASHLPRDKNQTPILVIYGNVGALFINFWVRFVSFKREVFGLFNIILNSTLILDTFWREKFKTKPLQPSRSNKRQILSLVLYIIHYFLQFVICCYISSYFLSYI